MLFRARALLFRKKKKKEKKKKVVESSLLENLVKRPLLPLFISKVRSCNLPIKDAFNSAIDINGGFLRGTPTDDGNHLLSKSLTKILFHSFPARIESCTMDEFSAEGDACVAITRTGIRRRTRVQWHLPDGTFHTPRNRSNFDSIIGLAKIIY